MKAQLESYPEKRRFSSLRTESLARERLCTFGARRSLEKEKRSAEFLSPKASTDRLCTFGARRRRAPSLSRRRRASARVPRVSEAAQSSSPSAKEFAFGEREEMRREGLAGIFTIYLGSSKALLLACAEGEARGRLAPNLERSARH